MNSVLIKLCKIPIAILRSSIGQLVWVWLHFFKFIPGRIFKGQSSSVIFDKLSPFRFEFESIFFAYNLHRFYINRYDVNVLRKQSLPLLGNEMILTTAYKVTNFHSRKVDILLGKIWSNYDEINSYRSSAEDFYRLVSLRTKP